MDPYNSPKVSVRQPGRAEEGVSKLSLELQLDY
jgi:hypothetical protein